MPPKSKYSFNNKRQQAIKAFTNRDKQISLFKTKKAKIKRDRREILAFIGVGGQGKSELCKKIRSISGAEESKTAKYGYVDFHSEHNRHPEKALLQLRRTLRETGKIKFTCLDIALTIYWEKAYPETNYKDTFSDIYSDSVGVIGDLASTGEELVERIPFGLGLGYKILVELRKLYKDLKAKAIDTLDGIESMDEQEILSRLPYYFGYDIKCFLDENEQKKLVVFFDTYEALWENAVVKTPSRASNVDSWVRDIVAWTPGVLFVFFSREWITWDKTHKGDWDGHLSDQYPIGPFGEDFAIEYLKGIPIKCPEIRNKIIKASEGLPFYLSLEADNYIDLKNRGEEPCEADFGGTKTDILVRFQRYRTTSELETLEILAIPQWFDKGVFQFVVNKFHTGVPATVFDKFTTLSIFTRDSEGGYRIHGLMRDHLLEDVKCNSDYDCFCKDLFSYFDQKAQPENAPHILPSNEMAFEQAYLLVDKSDVKTWITWTLEITSKYFSPARFHWLKDYIQQVYDAAEKAGYVELQLRGVSMLSEILFVTGNVDSVKTLCKENIDLAKREGLNLEKIELEYQYARSILELGEIDESITINRQILLSLKNDRIVNLSEETFHNLEVNILKSLSFSLSLRGNVVEAIKTAESAVKKADVFNLQNEMISRRAYLALYLSYTGNLKVSKELYEETLDMVNNSTEKANYKYELALTYGLYSEFSLINKDFEKCIDYSSMALEIDSEIKNPISGSWCNWLLSLSYAHQNKIQESLKYAETACLFDRPLNNPNPNVLLGILLLRLGNVQDGVKKLKQSINYIDKELLNKCGNNWEALYAKALALLALTIENEKYLNKAMESYTLGKSISPNKGHILRIQIQTRIVQPLLSEKDWKAFSSVVLSWFPS